MNQILPWISLIVAASIGVASGELRTWTSQSGSTIEAELVSFDGTNVVLKATSGTQVVVSAAKLTAEDQAFLKSTQTMVSPPSNTVPFHASGSVTSQSKTFEVKTALADWNEENHSLHIYVLPIEPTDEELAQIVADETEDLLEVKGLTFGQKTLLVRPNQIPGFEKNSPYLELRFHFDPNAAELDTAAIERIELIFYSVQSPNLIMGSDSFKPGSDTFRIKEFKLEGTKPGSEVWLALSSDYVSERNTILAKDWKIELNLSTIISTWHGEYIL